jgi:hypothetical protein
MNKQLLSCVALVLLFAVSTTARLHAQSGSIKGNIFSDTNGDAKVDEDEEDFAGQTVKLYRVDEKGNRIFVYEVVTRSDGSYEFGNLDLGSYVLVFEFSSGVAVETASLITLTAQAPNYVQQPIPYLGANYRDIYGDLGATPPLPGSPVGSGTLDALGLRNPANMTRPEASDFGI